MRLVAYIFSENVDHVQRGEEEEEAGEQEEEDRGVPCRRGAQRFREEEDKDRR